MKDRDYANRVLFMLSFKEMSGYQLSKNVKHDGEKMSSGTLVPILRNLESAGMIEFRKSGNKKLYSLTGKGRNYITSLKEIGEEVRKKMFVESMDRNLLYYDILTNFDDVEAIKSVLERMGDVILEIIKTSFRLEKSGSEEDVDYLEREIRKILEDM